MTKFQFRTANDVPGRDPTTISWSRSYDGNRWYDFAPQSVQPPLQRNSEYSIYNLEFQKQVVPTSN